MLAGFLGCVVWLIFYMVRAYVLVGRYVVQDSPSVLPFLVATAVSLAVVPVV